jgi:hypothetical protein
MLNKNRFIKLFSKKYEIEKRKDKILKFVIDFNFRLGI